MKRTPTRQVRRAGELEPAWEIAYLFPAQGAWTEDDYLELNGNHLVEFSHGVIEVLPMPTTSHQMLVMYLSALLQAFSASQDLGTVLIAALRVRLWRAKFREPDIVFMLNEHADRIGEEYWKGANLVMEVVSGSAEDRRRDLVTKREEYARARIAEYWIVDPRDERITVLRLTGKRYTVHGEFSSGETASSHLLKGFTVEVTEAFSKRLPKKASKARRRPRETSTKRKNRLPKAPLGGSAAP